MASQKKEASTNVAEGEKPVTVTELHAALAVKYAAPAWAYFEEVSSGTGVYHRRTADGLAVSLWPSRGYETHGFELKVYRGDFLKEMKDPEKAEAIFKYCDRWWLVCPNKLVKVEEVPKTWGLMVLKGDKLYIEKPAPELQSKEWGRPFVASLLRDINQQYIPKRLIEDRIEQAEQAATKAAEDTFKYKMHGLEETAKAVKEFEKASGVSIGVGYWRHTPTQIGKAVKVVLEHGVEKQAKDLERTRDQLQNTLKDVEKAISELRREQAGETFEPGEDDET